MSTKEATASSAILLGCENTGMENFNTKSKVPRELWLGLMLIIPSPGGQE